MNQFLISCELLFLVWFCSSSLAQDASPTPTPFKQRVVDAEEIGGPRPIDQDDALARQYVKEMTWSLSGDPAIAGTEDAVSLWNLAQQHKDKLNLQTVIDVSAYGNKSFPAEVQLVQTYPYAFISAYTAKLEGKEPTVQRLDRSEGKK
jgi:hypothetical protein